MVVETEIPREPTRDIKPELVACFAEDTDESKIDALKDLILECIHPDTRHRLIPYDAFSHAFFKQTGQSTEEIEEQAEEVAEEPKVPKVVGKIIKINE